MYSNGKDKGNREMKPYPSGSKIPEKLFSMDECAKHIIDSALSKIHKQIMDRTKQGGARKSSNASFGYSCPEPIYEKPGGSLGPKYPNMSPSRRTVGRQDPFPREPKKEEFSSILTSTIQKVMREAISNADDHLGSANRGYRQAPPPEVRPPRIKPLAKPNSDGWDINGNIEHVEMLDIEQLVKSMTKLCLLEPDGSGSNLGSGDTSHKQSGYSNSSQRLVGQRRASLLRANTRPSDSNGIIVTNQNAESGSLNKELQAVLQWMVASHFNVPNLTFLNDRDGDLSDLPRLAQKATKKGYSVGDVLQEVMRYLERLQMDDAMGKRPPCGLLHWLSANL